MSTYIKHFCIGLGILSLVHIPSVFAEDVCERNVQPIKKGAVANCTGYLFSPSSEEKASKAVETAQLRKEENEILERRLNLYIQQSDTLAKEVSRNRATSDLYRGLYFVAGALVTGFIAANVAK